jgi:hypothetical protein
LTKRGRARSGSGVASLTALGRAAEEAVEIADRHPELELVEPPAIVDEALLVRFHLDLSGLTPGPGGISVEPIEEIVLIVGSRYPQRPPEVLVPHERWLGLAHVMGGYRLCVYLDPDREWDPTLGLSGVLSRTWEWFEEAIAGRFDPRTALFHAFGGMRHVTAQVPLVVVRNAPPDLAPGIHRMAWVQRSPHRIDIVGWRRSARQGEVPGLAVILTSPLTRGAGPTFEEFLSRVDRPVHSGNEFLLPRQGFPSADMVDARIRRAATVVGPGQHLLVLVAAPNLAVPGMAGYDLVALDFDENTIAAAGFDRPRTEAKESAVVQLTYLGVDDTRPEISVRRDDRRPVQWFQGKTVELWGCGALGSWLAELLVRAGVAHLRLRDSATVTSGLLVRQNYTEDDIGRTKAEALADRLRLLADGTVIEPLGHGGAELTASGFPLCDLLVDATVSVAATAAIDHALLNTPAPLGIAQVATDSATATLGIVTLARGDGGKPISVIDRAIRSRVESDPALEAFGTFWDTDEDVLFAPARGCSTPTFRGSAADAMSISSAAISFIGPGAENGLEGAFLFSLPHSPVVAPARTWVEAS